MYVFIYVHYFIKSRELTKSLEILLDQKPALAVWQWTGYLITLPQNFHL